jgi:hypothetical protein
MLGRSSAFYGTKVLCLQAVACADVFNQPSVSFLFLPGMPPLNVLDLRIRFVYYGV